jgi:hypothetical protein
MPVAGFSMLAVVADPGKAFPEAVGPAAAALSAAYCVRDSANIQVIHITTTADSVEGSFRDAIENKVRPDTLDIIVFDQGGKHDIGGGGKWTWPTTASCIYIAGQSAPGGGVSFVRGGGQGQTWALEDILNHDIVFRYFWIQFNPGSGPSSNIRIQCGTRFYFDHLTNRWFKGNTGGNAGFQSNADSTGSVPDCSLGDVTLSYNMFYEPDTLGSGTNAGRHTAFSGNPRSAAPAGRTLAYRNYIGGPGHRLLLVTAGTLLAVNNIVFNWDIRGSESGLESWTEWIGNYHKTGNATGGSLSGWAFLGAGGCALEGTPPDSFCLYSLLWRANRNNKNSFTVQDEDSAWHGSNREIACYGGGPAAGTTATWECASDGSEIPDSARHTTPIAQAGVAVALDTLDDALLAALVDSVGNFQGIDALGRWFWRRDEKDTLQINRFENGTGHSEQWTDTVTVPTPATGSVTDSDGDGTPDAFETQCGLDPNTADDVLGAVSTNYTWLERWLNGDLDKGQRVAWDDTSDNEEWFIVLVKRSGADPWVAIDSVPTNITQYDDASGWPGDIYGVVAKNVNKTSDTLTIGTAGCN